MTPTPRVQPVEPVAGNPHGGFYEGGQAQAASTARPVPTHHQVNHDVLMARVVRKVKDERVLKLIRRYLEAGLMEGGVTSMRTEGTPQGGPLSPLLSNILLDDLDRELERRGLSFCRYADDCNIYVGSKRAGERIMQAVTAFLERRLKLKVNASKSAVARPWERKFLGYSMTWHKKPKLKIAQPSRERLAEKIRKVLREARGGSLKQAIERLNPVLRGWVAYSGRCGPVIPLDVGH